ncbi:MAG: hypothetical protein HC815_23655 [Richelia sp. RM1_1_1]|nr:hypothetical protein [Richelia sp. RM1_1_1]
MSNEVVCPESHQIFVRELQRWAHIKGKVVYNPNQKQTSLDATLKRFNLTKSQVVCELFKINGGHLGYYLANLREKKYYYYGTEAIDVKVKLLSLGIGRLEIN